MKTRIVLCLLLMIVITGCTAIPATQEPANPHVVLNTASGKHYVQVETVSKPLDRAKGLMYRKELAQDKGMFFVFEQATPLTFWMKNTLIPLDMIFINQEYKVVSIQKNAQPCKVENCPFYKSEKPASYVLEINGGLSDKFQLKNGDKIDVKI